MSLFTRLLAAAALSVFAVTSVHAAPSKPGKPTVGKSAEKTSADGIETVAADGDSAKSTVGGNSTTTLNTNTTEPTSTSTASLPTAIENASPRTVFGELYTETYYQMTDLENGSGSPQLDSYAGLKFDLGNGRSASVRQNFDYKGITATDGANNFHVQDIALNYADGKFATILGDGSLTFIARVYLPTGENSRFLTGNAGAERLYLVGSKSYGKMDLSYVVMGQYTNTTKDSFFRNGAEVQNRYGYGVHEFDAFYNVTEKFAVGALVGQEFKFLRALGGSRTFNSDIYIQPTLQYSPIKGLTFQAALYNEINTDQPTQDFALARDNEVSAFFNMSASL